MLALLARGVVVSALLTASFALPAFADPGLPGASKYDQSLDAIRREKVLQLTEELMAKSRNIGLMPSIYTADVTYEDPMVQVIGLPAVTKYFVNVNDLTPFFEIVTHNIFADGDQYISTWTAKVKFSVQNGAFSAGPITYEGSSLAKFRPGEDKVYFHRDYYDHSAVYASFPFIGPGFWVVRQLMLGELGKGLEAGRDFKDISTTKE